MAREEHKIKPSRTSCPMPPAGAQVHPMARRLSLLIPSARPRLIHEGHSISTLVRS